MASRDNMDPTILLDEWRGRWVETGRWNRTTAETTHFDRQRVAGPVSPTRLTRESGTGNREAPRNAQARVLRQARAVLRCGPHSATSGAAATPTASASWRAPGRWTARRQADRVDTLPTDTSLADHVYTSRFQERSSLSCKQ